MNPGLPLWINKVLAATALIVLSPLLFSIAVLVKVSSRGPVLHRGRRIGLHGIEFEHLKFRTMRICNGGPAITSSGDARVTRVGRYLRHWKLDELPQLANVARGQMALVGPRPENPIYVAAYTPTQRRLLDVLPGLTSPATIAYRHEEALLATSSDPQRNYVEDVLPKKLAIDLQWLQHRTSTGDLVVLVRTLRSIVSDRTSSTLNRPHQ